MALVAGIGYGLGLQGTVYIYSLEHPVTHEIRYIGKTDNIKRRLTEHLHEGRVNAHKRNWINQLKLESLIPIIEVIDEVPVHEWEFWEQHYISLYRSWGMRLINLKEGGNGGTAWNKGLKAPYSEEALKRMSASQKERMKKNPHPMLGKKHREETREKIKVKRASQIITEETRKKMSRNAPKISSETRAKMIATRMKNGYSPSRETRRKISETLKNKAA